MYIHIVYAVPKDSCASVAPVVENTSGKLHRVNFTLIKMSLGHLYR